MNYVRHLNGLFQSMNRDQRLTPQHISLYMGIFQLWNMNRFQNPVHVNRQELMMLSRIGGRNTYARCMKDLHRWGYIVYSCTGNFHTGWTVDCIRFDDFFSADGQFEDHEITPSSGINNDTGAYSSGTEIDTGTGLKNDTGTGLKSDTGRCPETLENTGATACPINKTNKINKKKKKKKKKTPKILLLKREKFTYETNPLHVENDKNFAEPL